MFADDFARLSQLLTLLKPAALYMSVARSKLRMSGLLAVVGQEIAKDKVDEESSGFYARSISTQEMYGRSFAQNGRTNLREVLMRSY